MTAYSLVEFQAVMYWNHRPVYMVFEQLSRGVFGPAVQRYEPRLFKIGLVTVNESKKTKISCYTTVGGAKKLMYKMTERKDSLVVVRGVGYYKGELQREFSSNDEKTRVIVDALEPVEVIWVNLGRNK